MKKFSWEVEKTYLILRVTDGIKDTTWRIHKNTPQGNLLRLFEDLQRAMWTTEPVEPPVPAAIADEQLEESEKASRATLAAKAAAVSAAGGEWWNKDSYEEDKIYVIGHGDAED